MRLDIQMKDKRACKEVGAYMGHVEMNMSDKF